jgi:hypothetical protein
MSDENPYAPPREDTPSGLSARPGELWEVRGDLLRVRDGATLPEICLHGSPPESPGSWRRLPLLVNKAWAQWLPALPLAAWVMLPTAAMPSVAVLLAGVLLCSLPGWKLAKRGSIHVFSARAASRRHLLRVFPIVLLAIALSLGVTFLLRTMGVFGDGRYERLASLVPAIVGTVAAATVFRPRIRAVRWDDGGFVLSGVHPDAIATLHRIQRGGAMVPNPPRDSGRPGVIVTPE